MKKIIIALVVIVLVGVGIGIYLFTRSSPSTVNVLENQTPNTNTGQPQNGTKSSSTPSENTSTNETVIGKSIQGNDIVAYHYGSGKKELLFIGAIHGGYEWNTALVAYDFVDYLKARPEAIPQNMTVTVIPVMNPDGLKKVVGTTGRFMTSDVPASQAVQISGRFNSNNVDLNRNFDCDWQATGVWQSTPVSGGSAAFSEPESRAIRDYVRAHNPTAVVVWNSAAGGVFSSSCHNGILAETKKITSIYATASGYPAYDSFDFYKLTGDMANWLAAENIPAISVLLTTHKDVEWNKNLAGIQALLRYYGK